VLEADGAAKVRMRSRVRGLRTIEKQILAEAAQAPEPAPAPAPEQEQEQEQAVSEPVEPDEASVPAASETPEPAASDPAEAMPAGEPAVVVPARERAVLDYCTTVRGILNDGQGGPLAPPGLAMAEGLAQVGDSIRRNLAAKKGGPRRGT
jgi:hypothetical protein